MKIAAVVILYNPEADVFNNIQSYQSFVDTVYVMDNTERPAAGIRNGIEKISNCIYLADGVNKGIAARLNEACALAIKDGCTYLLTMDQDSGFEQSGFERYIKKINEFPGKESVAMFAVNYQKEITPVSATPREVLSTITSGSIIDLNIHKIVGKYNEDLFIDLVDAEYCYRIIQLKYRIILFSDIILLHRLGYIKYGRSLKNFKLTPRLLHSPERIYYIVRNCFYMLYKFPNLPFDARKEIRNCLMLLKNNLLYHEKRGKVIRYIIKGYLDYRKNKMGKLEKMYM